MKTIIPGKLMRSSRPGYCNKDVTETEVDEWIEKASGLGVRTILCLLNEDQLSYYHQLGDEGLLERYRSKGFAVIHHPVPDHQCPPVPEKTLELIASDFLIAELPMLVHCSAGIDRTGAVVDFLTRKASISGFRDIVKQSMKDHSGQRGCTHFKQVTYLAVRLYDQLEKRHQLPPRYRSILWASGMLHDIGTDRNGPQSHQWRSGSMILEHPELGCEALKIEPLEIATVAALHGIDDEYDKSNPLGEIKDPIAGKWPEDRIPNELQILTGILRVADGLDRDLRQTVKDVIVEGDRLEVIAKPKQDVEGNIGRATEKSGLIADRLRIELKIDLKGNDE